MNNYKVKKITEVKPQGSRFINPEERIRRFQESIEMFYRSLEKEWLSTLNTSVGHVDSKEREYVIYEKGLENYKVKIKEIIIDNFRLFFKPVGTMFQGVYGQIDLIYGARSEMFVLIGKEITSPRQLLDRIDLEYSGTAPLPPLCELEWKYVSKYPDLKYETIDTEVFTKIIKRVIHG